MKYNILLLTSTKWKIQYFQLIYSLIPIQTVDGNEISLIGIHSHMIQTRILYMRMKKKTYQSATELQMYDTRTVMCCKTKLKTLTTLQGHETIFTHQLLQGCQIL